VTDEDGVASFYDKTTARFCAPLPSTLALHPKASFSQWRSLLVWTTSGPSSSYEIIDGLLHCIAEGGNAKSKSQRALILKSMESETRRIFEEMRNL
jgi:hypothetical protein